MKISVIIPTYKPQDYIWECLYSFSRQTFPKDDFEVILVLNGCCEPWKRTIENFIRTSMIDMNIMFIQTDIGGVSYARNIALDSASGEYITFVDDDDYVSDCYLQRLYEKAEEGTVVLSNAYAFNDGFDAVQLSYYLTDIYENYSGAKRLKLSSNIRKYFNGPCMKLFPRDIIRDRRFDVRFKNGEDSLFMFLISDSISEITFADKDAIYYRRFRANSAINRKRSRKERIDNTFNGICEYCKIYNVKRYNFIFFISRILAELKYFLKVIIGI